MKTFEVEATTKVRYYRKYKFDAKSKSDAISMFLKYLNKRKNFFTTIKTIEVNETQVRI